MTIKTDKAFYQKVETLASQGMRKKDIALALGMATATFFRKMQDDKRFQKAIEKGQESGLSRGVAFASNKMRELMAGVELSEERTVYDNKGNIKGSVTIIKKLPPNFNAVKSYLQNFGGWSDKSVIDHNVKSDSHNGGISRSLEILQEFRRERENSVTPNGEKEVVPVVPGEKNNGSS